MASYLMQSAVLSISAYRASQLLSLYWGGAMCGRFIGAGALRVVPPGIALAVCGALAASLALLSSFSTGTTAAVAIIAIGFCNSIMFPTIFALAVEGLGEAAPKGSGILCMAIVGGAIVPEISGIIADARGLAVALLVPALCYVWITIYGATIARHPARTPA
jgi:FHS family L-fucose permease-like MFS transporter